MTDTTKQDDQADRDWLRVKDVIQKLRDREWYYKQPVSHYRDAILEAYDELAAENASLRTTIDQLREDSRDAHEALRKELESLRREVRAKHMDWETEHAEVVKLRTAIDRVRALHARYRCKNCPACEPDCVECDVAYPCPTLRAIDGGDA
jgi:hypothetical protein